MGVDLCNYRARTGLSDKPKAAVEGSFTPFAWLTPRVAVGQSVCLLLSVALILLFAGDVERNPGPGSVSDDSKIS